jgi:glycosyltransferase involved in cell wall biosynthesis
MPASSETHPPGHGLEPVDHPSCADIPLTANSSSARGHSSGSDSRHVDGAFAPTPQSIAPDPRLSVVITCYNYGHYIESCIDSLFSQGRAPHEIVVIDDGSTDATTELLAKYAGSIAVIRSENRGQAAAFNVGFNAVEGDVILFLDADDLLRPDAVETILYHWNDEIAVLTFGLETIDAQGRSTGLYGQSLGMSGGDKRPGLLGAGTFDFPPTSGNAFSRRFLQTVLPMPEKRWRISADCYLIRAAALFGRFAHVPAILGSYRLHGSNNYAVGLPGGVDQRRDARNRLDNADALLDLADRADLFTASAAETAALKTALRF